MSRDGSYIFPLKNKLDFLNNFSLKFYEIVTYMDNVFFFFKCEQTTTFKHCHETKLDLQPLIIIEVVRNLFLRNCLHTSFQLLHACFITGQLKW